MTTAPSPAPPVGIPEPIKRTWKPTTAGILALIAGIMNAIVGIGALAFGSMFGGMMSWYRWDMPRETGVWAIIFGVVTLVIGAVSIVGGIYAMKRRLWGLALAGAICALFPPPLLPFGILSIVFVAMGKKEFNCACCDNKC